MSRLSTVKSFLYVIGNRYSLLQKVYNFLFLFFVISRVLRHRSVVYKGKFYSYFTSVKENLFWDSIRQRVSDRKFFTISYQMSNLPSLWSTLGYKRLLLLYFYSYTHWHSLKRKELKKFVECLISFSLLKHSTSRSYVCWFYNPVTHI